jgi:predicted TIM-barrel fold metal-dependent hydrolase
MSQGETDARVSSIQDVDPVVDADTHFNEGLGDVLPYMDEQHRAMKEHIAGSQLPLNEIFTLGLNTAVKPYRETGESQVNVGDVRSGAEKVAELEEYGIDYGVLEPSLFSTLPTVTNSRFAVALANAYNSFLLDTFGDVTDRMKLGMLVAPHKPHLAAEEIDDRADEEGIVKVLLPGTGMVPPPGDERYHPIYEAAEDNGLPVGFHTGGSSLQAFPMQYWWNETYAEDHTLFHPFSLMWDVTSMVFRGIPERFPDLDFVFSEAGIGWVPYLEARMDDHYMEYTYDIPMLERLPSEYMRERFHFTTQPLGHTVHNPNQVAQWIEMIGPDRVMYSADLPHHDFDTPEELFDRINRRLDPADVEAVMGGNAAELYGLG